MQTTSLVRHGEHIKPAYASTEDKPGWAGKSTDAERKGGQVSGIVERFNKKKSASKTALALGLIKSSFRDAIEYTGKVEGLRGMILAYGLFGGAVGFGVLPALAHDVFNSRWIEGRVTSGFAACAAFLFGAYMLLKTSRLELFCPQDEPVIFDRQHRKVYRLFRETHPGIKGLFKRWPMRACEYEWDLIDAEHNALLVSTGSTVTRRHALVFIVRRSASDPTIIDSFNVGNAMLLGEQTVAPMWEHIRRFMEEGGPHLPSDETLTPAERPKTLWQSMGAVGPVGPNYLQWWRDNPGVMVILHVLFPLCLPLFLMLGFFNWLSNKTATVVEWPDEVKRAVGERV